MDILLMNKLKPNPSAEVHGPVGHQGDGDHHGHEGCQRQPPYPLQHLHHEEADHYDGGLHQHIMHIYINFTTDSLANETKSGTHPEHARVL